MKVVDTKRKRLMLEFSPEAYERLIRIKKLSDCHTNAEVVKRSLAIMELLLDEREAGHKLIIADGTNIQKEIAIV